VWIWCQVVDLLMLPETASSNEASSYRKSFGAEYECEIGSIFALSWLMGHLSGEEMVLITYILSSGKTNSVAPPSQFIQSSHSSISISAWKVFSKILFSGSAKSLRIINSNSSFGARRYKFLVGITGSKFGVKRTWLHDRTVLEKILFLGKHNSRQPW
jgi:hypothetical protein